MADPKTPSAPHSCPDCGEPSYIGGPGMPTQCTQKGCPFYSEDCWVRHVLELPDVEDPFEDEDTEPQLGFPVLSDFSAPIRNLTYQPLPPKQQKALDIMNKAIDAMPKPFILTDDD